MCINWINAQKVDVRVELTKKKTSHCKSRDFLRKRRLKRAKCFEYGKGHCEGFYQIYSIKIILEGIPVLLENCFYPNSKHQKIKTLENYFGTNI